MFNLIEILSQYPFLLFTPYVLVLRSLSLFLFFVSKHKFKEQLNTPLMCCNTQKRVKEHILLKEINLLFTEHFSKAQLMYHVCRFHGILSSVISCQDFLENEMMHLKELIL